MNVSAGDTVTIKTKEAELIVKIEDTSKSESISGRVEEVKSGANYQVGQICEFDRNEITISQL